MNYFPVTQKMQCLHCKSREVSTVVRSDSSTNFAIELCKNHLICSLHELVFVFKSAFLFVNDQVPRSFSALNSVL